MAAALNLLLEFNKLYK